MRNDPEDDPESGRENEIAIAADGTAEAVASGGNHSHNGPEALAA